MYSSLGRAYGCVAWGGAEGQQLCLGFGPGIVPRLASPQGRGQAHAAASAQECERGCPDLGIRAIRQPERMRARFQ